MLDHHTDTNGITIINLKYTLLDVIHLGLI